MLEFSVFGVGLGLALAAARGELASGFVGPGPGVAAVASGRSGLVRPGVAKAFAAANLVVLEGIEGSDSEFTRSWVSVLRPVHAGPTGTQQKVDEETH